MIIFCLNLSDIHKCTKSGEYSRQTAAYVPQVRFSHLAYLFRRVSAAYVPQVSFLIRSIHSAESQQRVHRSIVLYLQTIG